MLIDKDIARENTQKFLDWAYGLSKVVGASIAAAVILAYQHNEVKSWDMLGMVISSAALLVVPVALSWIFFTSPKNAALQREHASLENDHAILKNQYATLLGAQAVQAANQFVPAEYKDRLQNLGLGVKLPPNPIQSPTKE